MEVKIERVEEEVHVRLGSGLTTRCMNLDRFNDDCPEDRDVDMWLDAEGKMTVIAFREGPVQPRLDPAPFPIISFEDGLCDIRFCGDDSVRGEMATIPFEDCVCLEYGANGKIVGIQVVDPENVLFSEDEDLHSCE